MITTGVWGEVSVLAASASLLLATLIRGRTRVQTPFVLWMIGASVGVLHAIRVGETDVLWQVSTNAPGFVALAVVVTLQIRDESAGSSSDRWTHLLTGSLSTIGLAWQVGIADVIRSPESSTMLKLVSGTQFAATSVVVGAGLVTLVNLRDRREPRNWIRGLLVVILGTIGLMALDSTAGWSSWFRPLVVASIFVLGILVVSGPSTNSRENPVPRDTWSDPPSTPSSLITFSPLLALCLLLVIDSDYGDYGWFVPAVLLALLAVLLLRLRALWIAGERLRRSLERSIEHRRLELEHSQRLYTRIVQLATDGIIATDRDLLVLDANTAAGEILGVPIDRMIGLSVMEIAPIHHPRPDDRAVRDFVFRSPSNDVLVAIEIDGQERTLEVSTRPLDGPNLGMVVVFRDVTERESLTRFKDNIISIVSHELRTPLTAIRGGLGLLEGGAFGPLDPAIAPLIRVVTENSDRLGKIVDDLLDVERFRSGRESLHREKVDVDSLFARLMTSMAPLIQQKGMSIRAIPSGEELDVDGSRVLQVLVNLVQNAVKFSPTNSTIELACEPVPDGHVVSVSDQGRGIPPNEMTRIFEPFHRVNGGDSAAVGGIGLGLAISAAIVRAHGGRIWASAGLDGGTTFSFFLPDWPSNDEPTPTNLDSSELSMIGAFP